MDYARAKLAGHDIFGTWVTCQMHEYVNIRGTYCSNCTALESIVLVKLAYYAPSTAQNL